MIRTLLFLLCMESMNSELSQSELDNKILTCGLDYTCKNITDVYEHLLRKCRCDDNCIDYGECCLDAAAYERVEQMKNFKRQECILGTNMVVKCIDEWENTDIKLLCESHSPSDLAHSEEPILHIPVTSRDTDITYGNYYCAVCNNDAMSVAMWESSIECSFMEDRSSYQTFNNYQYSGFGFGFGQNDNLAFVSGNFSDDEFTHEQDSYSYHDIFLRINESSSDGSIGDENIIKQVKANLRFSKWGEEWRLPDPRNENKTSNMTCSIQLSNSLSDPWRVPCKQSIERCAANWTDQETENLCLSISAPVDYSPHYEIDYEYDGKIQAFTNQEIVTYRNVYCAKCNHVHINHTCIRFIGDSGGGAFGGTTFPPLLILLRPPDFITTPNITGTGKCKENELYISLYENCNSILCLSSGKESKKVCIPKSGTSMKSPDKDEKSGENNNNHKESYTHQIISGSTTENEAKIKVQLDNNTNSHENESIINFENLPCEDPLLIKYRDFINTSGVITTSDSRETYNPGMYEEIEGGILACSSPYSEYYVSLGWVTLVCLSISIVCISLHLVAFVLVHHLRNLQGMNLATLCVCLLGGYISYIVGPHQEPKSTPCYIAASTMYFCFFASLCWMTVIAFDTWQSFRNITWIHTKMDKKRKLYVRYSLCSWTVAILALASLVTIDKLEPTGVLNFLLPKLGVQWCWFGNRASLTVFFVVPMIIASVINVLLYITTVYRISGMVKETRNTLRSNYDRNLLWGNIRLAASMGITWVTGVIAWYTQHDISFIVFTVVNALQGAFIFVAFTCNKRVREAIMATWLGMQINTMYRRHFHKDKNKRDRKRRQRVSPSQDPSSATTQELSTASSQV